MSIKIEIKKIPKIELHCHLDGSVSKDYLKSESRKQSIDIDISKVSVEQDCNSLVEYLQCFDEILKVMQTKESLIEAIKDVARQAKNDGIAYIEIRFAPLLHINKGLTIGEVLNSVSEGVKFAESKFDIGISIILCGMKHHSQAQNIELFKHLHQNKNDVSCIRGIDFAGGESDDESSIYEESVKYVLSKNLNLTIHAGECGCAKNVYDAVVLGTNRVGHGVAAIKDAEILNHIKKNKTLLEICPKSNLQTKAIQSIKDLEIKKLIDDNVNFIINTDNRTVTNTNLIEEYELLYSNHMITLEQIKLINKNVISYIFGNDDQKDALRKLF